MNNKERREELEEVIVLININNMRVDYFLLPLEITVVHVHKTTNVDRWTWSDEACGLMKNVII